MLPAARRDRIGPRIKLPDLLRVIAQCPKWDDMSDGCPAQYSPTSQIDARCV